MDIAQILITAGAVVGIAVVAIMAIVPTLMEIPAPSRVDPTPAAPTPLRRPSTRTGHPRDTGSDDFHLAA